MPFVTIPGLKGRLYVPEEKPGTGKKHPCPDCFSCQQCSASRCQVCRNRKKRTDRKPIQIQDKMGKNHE